MQFSEDKIAELERRIAVLESAVKASAVGVSSQSASSSRSGSAKLRSPSSTDVFVEVNVGGTLFSTFRSTLTSHSSSMLAAMFSGRHPLTHDDKGRPFIDRNPRMFALVLEYLRTDLYPAKLLSSSDVPFFEAEIDYFGLERPLAPVPVDRLNCRKLIKVDTDDRMLILCFDVYGDHMVIGCRDGSVQIWSKEDGSKTGQLMGHNSGVTDIRILLNAAGRVVVVSASTDSTIRLWDLWSHQQLRLIEGSGPIASLDFMFPTVDGLPLLATAGKACAVFNLATGVCLQSWNSDDGSSFNCVKSDNGAVFGSTGCQINEFSLKSGFVQNFVCYSPVKHFVVTPSELLASYADCSIGIWSRSNGQLVRSLIGHSSICSKLLVVGSLLFSGCYNGSLLVWNLRTGNLARTVDVAHSAVIRGIKWLDSGLLVSVGADAKIMVWQMHSSPGEDEMMVSPDFDRKRLIARSASGHNVLL